MAKRELGAKHYCPECHTRFYDFKRQPPLCPKCGAASSIPATPFPEPKEERPTPETAAPPPDVAEEPPEQTDADEDPDLTVAVLTSDDDDDENLKPVQGGEADDGVIEDASDLGEDDDDMSEAREHVDEGVADQG